MIFLTALNNVSKKWFRDAGKYMVIWWYKSILHTYIFLNIKKNMSQNVSYINEHTWLFCWVMHSNPLGSVMV